MITNTYTEYTCEICGRTYSNENDCVMCEQSHLTDFKISSYKYPKPEGYGDIEFQGDNRFPNKLVLLFETASGEEIEKEYLLNEGRLRY